MGEITVTLPQAAVYYEIFWRRLVDAGNLNETRHEYGSKEMRNIGVLTVRPAGRHKVNPHLGVVLVGL